MLELLDGGPATVSVLAEPFQVSLTAINQHVRVLERSGLIRTEKIGRERVCSLDRTAVERAETWLHTRRARWERRLDRLADHLDHTATTEQGDT
jgi:DNA-binding transcriptional ArsR family regulator